MSRCARMNAALFLEFTLRRPEDKKASHGKEAACD